MTSFLDYPELEGRSDWESERYTFNHHNWKLAWTARSAAKRLSETYGFVSRTAGNDIDNGKMFQHVLVSQSANALESLFLLVKNHQYNGARGRGRYLFETYLILRRLNRNQEKAAEKWEEVRQEVREIPSEDPLRPLNVQPDTLHSFRREEQEKIYDELDQEAAYRDFWALLSNRGSHPTSMIGSQVDGRYSPKNEVSLLTIGCIFSFGIATQYVRTFAGTPTRWRIQRLIDPLIVEVKNAISPRGLPKLFHEEKFFWEPGLWRSPFVSD
ncbi:hypothetical protein ACKVMT_09950 [Halobacteriales archaeon Cl-PHB]